MASENKKNNCSGCLKGLVDNMFLKCSFCSDCYDLECAGISEQCFVGEAWDAWKCVACKSKQPKTGNQDTPARAGAGGVTVRRGASRMSPSGLDALAPEPLTLEAIFFEVLRSREETREQHRDVCAQIAGLKDMVRELSGRVERCEGRVTALDERISSLESRSNSIGKDSAGRLGAVEQRLEAVEARRPGPETDAGAVAELERTVSVLRQELNDRDQEALLADLEIGQLPEAKGENVLHSVCVLASRLGVPLEERDVVFAERVGAPPAEAGGRARRVVVRLARRHLRDELLRAARVRRGVAEGGGRVFVNERLTRSNRQLYHQVREECRKLQWRYSWTRRGRVFVRRSDGAQVFQIRSPDDFLRVFGPPAI
ncbi:hypothetical protein ABMA27_003152 [Loxostege sticticalis]|uniref:FP protein C-terminal domain-containing protein n=1 Tax=Loxostege sticticalis TaxID=481309 RepID=A0ABR3HS65_LOXSC